MSGRRGAPINPRTGRPRYTSGNIPQDAPLCEVCSYTHDPPDDSVRCYYLTELGRRTADGITHTERQILVGRLRRRPARCMRDALGCLRWEYTG